MENNEEGPGVDNKSKAEQSAERVQENPVAGSAERVQAAIKEVKEDGKVKVKKIEDDGGTSGDVEEMQDAVRASTEEAEKEGEQCLEEEKQENRLEAAKDFLKKNWKEIEGLGNKILDGFKNTGEIPDANTPDVKFKTDLTELLHDEKLLKDLENSGLLNQKMIYTLYLIIPFVDRMIEFDKEVGGSEKFAQAIRGVEGGSEEERNSKEAIQRVALEIISSTDAEKDPARIAAAGMLLIKYSSKLTSPASLAVKALGMSLQVPIVQNYLSKKFRNEIEKKKDELKEGGKSEEDIEKETVEEILDEMEF